MIQSVFSSILVLFFPLLCLGAFDPAYPHWSKVLKNQVTLNKSPKRSASEVAYSQLKADPSDLNAFIGEVQAVPLEEFQAWTEQDRLAFLINTYNAFTVKMVVDALPIKSFKDIGGLFSNPWQRRDKFKLFGETISPELIERNWIRKQTKQVNPLFSFALTNATKGAPRLLNEPYLGSKLEKQLDDVASLYTADLTQNGYNPKTNTFEVSQFFKWHREDLVAQAGSVPKFLAARMKLEPPLTEIALLKANVKYLDYDWSLNGK